MKRFVSVFLAMALLVSFCIPAFANDGTVIMYTTTTVSAYALPSASSQVLATLPSGTRVTTYPEDDSNGFKHCFTNETRFCYIPSVFLSTSSGGSPSPSPSPSPSTNERVVSGVSNYLALRSEPATRQSNEIGKLYNGETFYVTNFRSDGFAYGKTSYGQYGYVNASYLAVPGGSGSGTTWYGGYDWSPVYNYEYYKNHYPDVVAALGTSPEALISHFVNNGIYEARQGRSDWNVKTYMSQHPEYVSIYGNDYSAYYKIAVGIRP